MAEPAIPFVDLVTLHRELEEELLEVVRGALCSASFVGGEQVERFEHEFAAYCGTRYCVGVSSGTDAVRFALIASGVGPGDAVVTVAHTFIATVEAISQTGASTEFIDIDEQTCTMSPRSLGEYLGACRIDARTGQPIGRRTGRPIKAVVPVHLYGRPAAMDPLLDLARAYGLTVVEDACQAHGAEYRSAGGSWRRAGGLGRAGAFSFYPGKNLGACGEAGAVTTDDEHLALRVRMLRDHGQTRKGEHVREGYNGRLDAIQAGFLRVKLRHLDEWNARRRAAARKYDELLAHVPSVVTPHEPRWSRGNAHLYVVRVPDRDALARHLGGCGISTGVHYQRPLHRQRCYRRWHYPEGSLPATERVASEVLSLPMFPQITVEQQERVACAIDAFAGREVVLSGSR